LSECSRGRGGQTAAPAEAEPRRGVGSCAPRPARPRRRPRAAPLDCRPSPASA